MPPKMEHPWPNGNPSGGSSSAGAQAGRGLSGGTPLDKPPGLQPTAQEGQQALQLLADQGTSNRWDAMEHRMLGMEREMRSIRADLQNVLQAANMASEDAQKAALRMDNLEYEWLLWNDGHDYDASDQEQQCAEEGGLPPPPRQSPQEFELTPAATPRAAEGGVNTDLLGLELDPARQWWDAAPTQLVQDRSSMLQLTDLQTGPSPGEGTLQLIAGGRAVVATTAPPGIERTMALAIGNRAGERPEGPSQASRQSYGEGIWGGDVNPVHAQAPNLALPGVTTVSLMNPPAFRFEGPQGDRRQGDSDIISFLAGARPRIPAESQAPPGSIGRVTVAGPAMDQSSALRRGAAPEMETNLLNPQTGTAPPSASMAAPSMGELNMILKILQSLVPEFSKLELGEPGTRARRLQQWLLQVSQAIEPAGPYVTSWWQWVRQSAESTHHIYLTKPLDQREQVCPREILPTQYAQVESWLRPRILATLPKQQKDWVDLRAQAGQQDPSNVLVYYLFKLFSPGSPGEKDSLMRKVINPNVCTNPGAAQIELMRWRTDVHRLSTLGCMPPDLMMSYRALESIFGVVFDKAEPQLHLRWIMMKNRLGLPHLITTEALGEVFAFADAELSALVLVGGSSLNPGLPLTDNQRARQVQQKDGDKKKAAKAVAAATASWAPSAAATPQPVAARLSSSLSSWAQPCNAWQKGECKRGVSCHFQHAGFPTEEKNCFICKSSEHGSKECKCPGGGADPEKDKHWEEYRARRTQAEGAGKVGKGAKGGAKGKSGGGGGGKGKGKGKPSGSKGQGKASAGACIDLRAAAAAGDERQFPRDCVALDSWANVWLKHQKDKPEAYYQDVLHLAHGECFCHKETSAKGIPTVYVPWSTSSDNIDLFPEGFLWERGCSIMRGDELKVLTPKKR